MGDVFVKSLSELPLPIWRVGRKVGRTLYIQTGVEPADTDIFIGVMDTPELAALAVKAVNAHLQEQAKKNKPSRPREEA